MRSSPLTAAFFGVQELPTDSWVASGDLDDSFAPEHGRLKRRDYLRRSLPRRHRSSSTKLTRNSHCFRTLYSFSHIGPGRCLRLSETANSSVVTLIRLCACDLHYCFDSSYKVRLRLRRSRQRYPLQHFKHLLLCCSPAPSYTEALGTVATQPSPARHLRSSPG